MFVERLDKSSILVFTETQLYETKEHIGASKLKESTNCDTVINVSCLHCRAVLSIVLHLLTIVEHRLHVWSVSWPIIFH